MHSCVERVARLEAQLTANWARQYNLPFRGKFGFHGKTILPSRLANHKDNLVDVATRFETPRFNMTLLAIFAAIALVLYHGRQLRSHFLRVSGAHP
ncbi:MAG: hypothetical protein AUF67_01935 [Acidobacteria bacterium 13_1_20CM_58_21]|nr:MAG: hypothetical protein AUF67_01935 [Acidobacteria bacterium 13_1_20CM_58_21]